MAYVRRFDQAIWFKALPKVGIGFFGHWYDATHDEHTWGITIQVGKLRMKWHLCRRSYA